MIAVGPRGLLMLRFLKQSADAAMGLAALRLKFDPVPDERPAHGIGAEIARFLDGDRQALRSRIDLSLTNGEFEHAVLKALYEVPRGALLSYQGLGASVGAPRAARAVGNVMHNNPVPVYVPCHQVICSDGSIGNYGGGVETKIRLLRAEGFAIGSKHQLAGDAVWGHRKSRIFCRPSCPAARRVDSANFMIFANHNAAAKSGMRPCKVCRPG
jgi:methylated-DNA-[protein]-cysteine S-methyltransferase